jgi:hypothetical protein
LRPRNDLAKAAMAAGDVAVSAQVKTLRKPTLAAWLANQLVRAVPERIDELTELGAELREAHLSCDGARLRILTPRRHDLVTDAQTGRLERALTRATRAAAGATRRRDASQQRLAGFGALDPDLLSPGQVPAARRVAPAYAASAPRKDTSCWSCESAWRRRYRADRW